MNSRASELSGSGASMLSMYFSTLLADENIDSARVWRFPKMSVCDKGPAHLRALTGLIDDVRAYQLEVCLRSFQDGTIWQQRAIIGPSQTAAGLLVTHALLLVILII